MYIDTQIDHVVLEIEGGEYPVAEKTVAVADELIAVAKKYEGKPQYQLWRAELDVLLGRTATAALFRDGKKENLDRMERIHRGALQAFDHNSRELSEARVTEKTRDIADALAPINRLLEQVNRMDRNGAPVPVSRK